MIHLHDQQQGIFKRFVIYPYQSSSTPTNKIPSWRYYSAHLCHSEIDKQTLRKCNLYWRDGKDIGLTLFCPRGFPVSKTNFKGATNGAHCLALTRDHHTASTKQLHPPVQPSPYQAATPLPILLHRSVLPLLCALQSVGIDIYPD